MNELHLFAGAGGGILGGLLLGHRPVCAVEIEPYPRKVLLQRQRDGILPRFPIWNDIRTFDGKPWRGKVDVVCGGFPCQDISAAGKGAGIDGERSGLWGEMARVVREVGPRIVFVENSPMLTSRGLGTVLGDLAAMGYDARWCVLGADDVGAPHRRKRIWIYASLDRNANGEHVGKIGGIRAWSPTDFKGIRAEHPDANGIGHKRRAVANEKGLPEIPGHRSGDVCSNVADASRVLEGRPEQRPERKRTGESGESEPLADAEEWNGYDVRGQWAQGYVGRYGIGKGSWWESEPAVGRVANGVASRVDRLKAIGNGQVPAVAATAWRILEQ